MKTWRLILGITLSPLAAPLLTLFWPTVLSGGDRPYTSTNVWWVVAASGLCSYAGMLVFGLPVLYGSKRWRRLTLVHVTLAGAIGGILVFSLAHVGVVSIFQKPLDITSIRYVQGAILGSSVAFLAGVIAGVGNDKNNRLG